MAMVTTHPGGPFYEWYRSVYGYGPPAQVNDQASRYLAWQQGMPKWQAAAIPYGAIGNPGVYEAGGAILSPPSSPVPPPITVVETPAPPPAPPPPPPPPPAAGDQPTATTAAVKARPTQYGQALTDEQLQICDDCFTIATQYTHDPIVLGAMYYAMVGESQISREIDNGGVFQTTCDLSAYNNGADYQSQCHSFLNGGTCFARGAISYRRDYGTEWQIAGATEENAVWGSSRGDSYARSGFTTAELTAAAKYAVSFFAGGISPSAAPAPAPQTPVPSVGGVFDMFKALNWSGDFENLWKYVMGGSNEASNMAKVYNENTINKLTMTPWH